MPARNGHSPDLVENEVDDTGFGWKRKANGKEAGHRLCRCQDVLGSDSLGAHLHNDVAPKERTGFQRFAKLNLHCSRSVFFAHLASLAYFKVTAFFCHNDDGGQNGGVVGHRDDVDVQAEL